MKKIEICCRCEKVIELRPPYWNHQYRDKAFCNYDCFLGWIHLKNKLKYGTNYNRNE